jgi:hypothetical protein
MSGPIADIADRMVQRHAGSRAYPGLLAGAAPDRLPKFNSPENGDKFPATLIGADARTDVALLKVKSS